MALVCVNNVLFCSWVPGVFSVAMPIVTRLYGRHIVVAGE